VDDLPDSLPAGDVYMVGEITLDGEVIATTPAQPLGGILMTRLGLSALMAQSTTPAPGAIPKTILLSGNTMPWASTCKA